jgi:hypothetical protein
MTENSHDPPPTARSIQNVIPTSYFPSTAAYLILAGILPSIKCNRQRIRNTTKPHLSSDLTNGSGGGIVVLNYEGEPICSVHIACRVGHLTEVLILHERALLALIGDLESEIGVEPSQHRNIIAKP